MELTKQDRAMEITELKELGKKYLSTKALEALSKKAYTSNVLEDSSKYYTTLYLCRFTRNEDKHVEENVKEICAILNELAEDGLIHSALTPLSALDMAKVPFKAQSKAVFSYPLVPGEKYDEIRAKYDKFVCVEGEIKGEDDLSIDLKPGEFLFEARATLIPIGNLSVDDMIDNQIKDLLAILPKGTTVVEKTECATISLFKSVEVRLFNPLMQRIAKVELGHAREVAFMEPGRVDHFNLLVRVRYFDRDNKELYV